MNDYIILTLVNYMANISIMLGLVIFLSILILVLVSIKLYQVNDL